MEKTFIRWVGGKSKLAHLIASRIPHDHLAYIEPFFGSGAVLFAKKPSKVEIANDINSDLIAFFRVVQERPEELIERFRFMLVHESTFNEMASALPTDELDKAVRLYYLSRIAFAGDVAKPYFSPSARSAESPKTRWTQHIREDAMLMHKRLRTVLFLCRRAEEVLEMADENSVVYCDPPYPGTHGYGVDLDWDFMFEWMETTPARWILSINDIPLIQDNVIPIAKTVDTVKLYRPISKSNVGRKTYSELLITNFARSELSIEPIEDESDLSDLPMFGEG